MPLYGTVPPVRGPEIHIDVMIHNASTLGCCFFFSHMETYKLSGKILKVKITRYCSKNWG